MPKPPVHQEDRVVKSNETTRVRLPNSHPLAHCHGKYLCLVLLGPLEFLRFTTVYLNRPPSTGGSGWIISVGDLLDNLFTALGSSVPRE